jgi:salicylate hydroxylase
MNERIAIIGGGIGGLCLAQGLRQAGARVTVYERDRTPADRLQGYRVHIDPNGAEALRTCLPPHLWQAFLDTTGTGGQDFAFVTEQMKLLALIETPPDAGHYSVSRITLRQVLLSGLDDVVRFGKRFERYERLSDGRYELHFADGTRERADIVVGADGGGSRVRQQYLPHAKRVDTGITTVAGKHLLTPAARVRLPETLTGRLNTVIPPAGMGMFVAPHELEGVAARDGIGVTEQEGALMDNSTSYVMWAIGAARNRFPSDISEMSGVQLRDAVSRMIEAWHPDLRELVAGSHPDTVSLLPIRTSIRCSATPSTA